MKKLLLVEGYYTSGHTSAVRALEEEISRRGLPYNAVNIFTGKSAVIDQIFTIFRTFAAKGVKTVPEFLKEKEFIDLLAEEVLLPELGELDQYEGIISTHPYSSMVLAAKKERERENVPLVDVHTDYTPFPIFSHPQINFHVGAQKKKMSRVKFKKKFVKPAYR